MYWVMNILTRYCFMLMSRKISLFITFTNFERLFFFSLFSCYYPSYRYIKKTFLSKNEHKNFIPNLKDFIGWLPKFSLLILMKFLILPIRLYHFFKLNEQVGFQVSSKKMTLDHWTWHQGSNLNSFCYDKDTFPLVLLTLECCQNKKQKNHAGRRFIGFK